MTVDVLAVGAHPDDVDIGVGGTLLTLAAQGYTTGILDLTLGELSSRGTVEERKIETRNAANLLNVSVRENAELPDGGLQNIPEQRLKIIPVIRKLQPKIVLIHREFDRHPDHRAAASLTRDANFFAGVHSITTDDPPYRAPHVYTYNPYSDLQSPPAIVMDISSVFEQKLNALHAYESQLHNHQYEGPHTHVSTPEFWDGITKRAAYWGHQIDSQYGEPLYREAPLGITHFSELESTK